MQPQKHLQFILYVLYALLAVACIAVLFRGILPFILAFLLSCLLEPAVRFLTVKTHFRRSWAAASILFLFFAVVLFSLWFLLRRLWYELTVLKELLPGILSTLQSLMSRGEGLLYRFSIALPPDLQGTLQDTLSSVGEQLSTTLSSLSARALSSVIATAGNLPAVGLFVLAVLLGSFFIVSGRPTILGFLWRQVPPKWQPKLHQIGQNIKFALGSWIRAQGILIAVNFLVLCVGFLLLGTKPAFLLAAGLCLLDALPVFGAGLILVPWAVILMIGENYLRGSLLLVLYIVLLLLRSFLEPKLLANQTGLPPVAALLCMYIGFTLFGIAGMFLLPLLAVILQQLHHSHILHLWK